MKRIHKILLSLFIFCALGAGVFIYDGLTQARAEQCYYPFMMIDDIDRVYNGAVCENNYQVYYFPVITDGRKYTITLHSIEGEQKLYASRYKGEVDEYGDFNRWYCNDDHCDSSTEINDRTKIVTFTAPIGEPGYYSWFAVLGTTASTYQVGISNSGILKYVTAGSYTSPNSENNSTYYNNSSNETSEENSSSALPRINWKTTDTKTSHNFNDLAWTNISYNDSHWEATEVPSKDWGCDDCYRQFRGEFNLDSIPSDLKIAISSDDGIWLYVNGKFIGRWGTDNFRDLKCVNGIACSTNEKVDDILLNNLVVGRNVVSAIIMESGLGEYFNAYLVR